MATVPKGCDRFQCQGEHRQLMTVTQPSTEAKPGSIVYTAYAWTVFVLCLFVAFCAATVLPGLDRRRYWVSFFARLVFRLVGIRASVRGIENLPEGHSVVVANHASYLDGVILQAFLPPRFSYVIKNEMQKVPAAGFMLRRIGSRFVDRFNASASARDARTLMRAANSGEALGFFPEGTFQLEPGLGRFRSGAFLTAVKSEVPLVPVVIHGSRWILPAETFRVRHGHLSIDVLMPISPGDPEYAHHKSVAAMARERMLAVLDEPDLAARA